MDFLDKQTFDQLIEHKQKNSVSIYMPTQKAGRETRQNAVRFKNLVKEAQERLQEKGMRQPEAQTYLQSLWDLVDDQTFWQRQECGLAVFLGPNSEAIFRLPLDFSETMVINHRFHIKPLLPLFVENERFYVLTLSQQNVSLFSGTRFDVAELDLGDTPTSLAEALKYDDPERELQHHTSTAGAGLEPNGMFHSQTPSEDELEAITRFCHKVDQGVVDVIGGESRPLVLVGFDYLLPIYREANSYPNLIDEGISINPEDISEKKLHQKAWEIIEPNVEQLHQEAIERYKALASTEQASDQLEEIVPAARYAKVDMLFVPLKREAWGSYDPDTDTVMRQEKENPESRDLIDYAVIHTLKNGGSVLPLEENELPSREDRPLAAIFRY